MRILFLSQRVPDPPNKGDKIRSHHLARRLARNHELHVACLLDDLGETSDADVMRGWAASGHTALRRPIQSIVEGSLCVMHGEPISAGWFFHRGLAQEVQRLLSERRFDVVWCYCSSMARYVSTFRGARVLDFVDVDSEKWRQYAERSSYPKRAVYSLEHRLLRKYEARLMSDFDRTVVISPAEKRALEDNPGIERTRVIANGVDFALWSEREPSATSEDLVFVGALDYFANAEGIIGFARNVFPAIRRRSPGTRLKVVGRRPGEDVLALRSIEGVDVIGEVPDARPFVWNSGVVVVPLHIAQGLQNKVLEAMAAGVPVVASPAALRGLDGQGSAKVPARCARSDEEFVEGTIDLLQNREQARALADEAKCLVAERFSWDKAAKEMEEVLVEAVEAARNRAKTPAQESSR